MKKFLLGLLLLTFALPFWAQSAYYEGDGGKNLSIEVAKVEVKGRFSDEQDWFPDFASNMIHDDMEKYSAIKMIDGTNLEAQMDIDDRNINSGLFQGASSINYKAAENTLFITLSITPGSYNLSVRVNHSNETKASHNKNYSVPDMQSGLALKTAVADILDQLGVKLTKAGRDSLLAVEKAQGSIEAQKLNAQAEVASRSGDELGALTYLVKAKGSDSNLKRTSLGIKNLSAKLSSKNVGDQARNQIQLRKDFIKLLDETEAYLKNACPVVFVPAEGLQLGKVDYEKEWMQVSLSVLLLGNPDAQEIITAIKNSYKTMPDASNWGVRSRVELLGEFSAYISFYLVDVQENIAARCLLDEKGIDPLHDDSVTLTFGLPGNANTNNLKLKVAKIIRYDNDIERLRLESSYNEFYVENKNNRTYSGALSTKEEALAAQKIIDKEKPLFPAESIFIQNVNDYILQNVIISVPLSSRVSAVVGEKRYFSDRLYGPGRLIHDVVNNATEYAKKHYPEANTARNKINLTEEEKAVLTNYADLKLPFIMTGGTAVDVDLTPEKLLPLRIEKPKGFNTYLVYNSPELKEKYGSFYKHTSMGGMLSLVTFDEELLNAYKAIYPSIRSCVKEAYTPCRSGNYLCITMDETDIHNGEKDLKSLMDSRNVMNELFSQITHIKLYINRDKSYDFTLYRVNETGYNKLREQDPSLPPFESVPAKKVTKQVISDIKKYYNLDKKFNDASKQTADINGDWVRHGIEGRDEAKKMIQDMKEYQNHIYLHSYGN